MKLVKYILLLLLVNSVLVAKVPKYEGVYLVKKNKELIKLKRYTGTSCNVQISNQMMDMFNGRGLVPFRYQSLKTLNSIPVIGEDDISGFYMNSKDDQFEKLKAFSIMKDFVDGYSLFENKGHAHSDSIEHIAYGKWGYNSEALNAKHINNFTSFFSIKGLESSKNGSATSNNGDDITRLGMYVNTKKSNYPFFTKTGLNMFLWNMHEKNQYLSNYSFFLKKLEKNIKRKDIPYWDTLAWVYKDNNNKAKALKIYKTIILPEVKNMKDKDKLSKYLKYYKEIKK